MRFLLECEHERELVSCEIFDYGLGKRFLEAAAVTVAQRDLLRIAEDIFEAEDLTP